MEVSVKDIIKPESKYIDYSLHTVSYDVCMLGAKHGPGQSMDWSAQSMDPCFTRQSMDCTDCTD